MAYDNHGRWYKVQLTERDWKFLEARPIWMNFVADQQAKIDELRQKLSEEEERHQREKENLQGRIRDLERRFLKDSHNSHQPPSQDRLDQKRHRLSRGLRGQSGKPVGGQPGHPGLTRLHFQAPQEVLIHRLLQCKGCGNSLGEQLVEDFEVRQLVDLRQGAVYVSEHQAEKKRCEKCLRKNRAPFPKEVRSSLSYGAQIQSLALYFSAYQLIPVARTCEIFRDLYGLSLSAGTVCRFQYRASGDLKGWENQTKKALIHSKVLHSDETGIGIRGQGQWLHVASNAFLTLLAVHARRGQDAWDDIGVLPEFRGYAVHDGFRPYFKYKKCHHALCNVHHLRELTFLEEEENESWAGEMKKLLLYANEYLSEVLNREKRPSARKLHRIEREYYRVLAKGYATYNESMRKTWHKKKPKEKQDPGKNLLDRLRDHHRVVLAFLLHWDLGVPFSNNQAEQDLRMAKLKQKISGGFRSERGAQSFCRVRSYLGSLKKQGISPLHALQLCFT